MKFSTALLLTGAAVASAAAIVPKDGSPGYCPVVKKTVKISWIEVKEFTPIKPASRYDLKYRAGNSKFDPSQVYPGLNGTKGGGYATNRYTSSARPTSSTPYPTGTFYSNGTYTGGPTSTGSHGPSITSTTSATATPTPGACTSLSTRVEWHNLDDGQRDNYVAAVKCLINKPSANTGTFPGSRNRYEDFASLHQQLAGQIHEVGSFLPWHRYFIHVFEEVLRDECGYRGPMVWWDETIDAGHFADSSLFTNRWFGQIHPEVDGQGVCVMESGFGAYEVNLGPDGMINNPHCLSRAVDEGASANTNQDAVNECMDSGNFADYAYCLERGVHAYGHIGVGAVMANVGPSPEDPVFWLHHGFIDRNYKVWQNAEWWNRIYEIGGPSPDGGVTQPTDVLTSYGIRPDATIADVLDTEGSYLCYVYDKQ